MRKATRLSSSSSTPSSPTSNEADLVNGQSLRALDWLNFFMADVATGVGPFLAIYLSASRHWNAAVVGLIVGAQSIAQVVAQGPAGAIVDGSHRKPWLVVAAAAAVALGCLGIILSPNPASEVITQVVIGIAAAFFPPAIAAISLGMVGHERLPHRAGRNESFNHAGNVVFAVLAGALGTWAGQRWIFYASAAVALGTIAASLRIRLSDIDNDQARGSDSDSNGGPIPLRQLARYRNIWIFTASVILFHFANAAMLPLVGELLSKDNGRAASFFMSACIIAAQAVMVPVAWLTGKLADPWGRKSLFLVGFAVLALRGLLYTLGKGAVYLLAVQSLDGIGAAIFGVLWVIVIADLAQGTGRFNLLQGVIQAALGIGAFLSNSLAGVVARSYGFNTAFLGLAAIALLGLLFFAMAMPETKGRKMAEPERLSFVSGR